MTTLSAFDLGPGRGQLSTTCRFDVIDGATGVRRFSLHPSRGTAPVLTHDSTSTISRRLEGLTLLPDEAAEFNPLRDRVLPTMVVGGDVEYPLGRYVASNDVQAVQSVGDAGVGMTMVRPLSLYDEMFVIDQKLSESFSAGGVLVPEAIKALLTGLPILEPLIGGSAETSDTGWSAGTSRATALADLCSSGGFLSPWFDNTGVLRCLPAFDPASVVPTFDYDSYPSIIRGSLTVTDESVSAPNRFVVVSNDTTDQTEPIVGTYDVPATAPHSIANRGFVVPSVADVQVTSTAQAQVYARTIGLQQTIAERAEFETPPDPRHDAYDVVRLLGENWLEIGWSITLTGTGTMRHVLSRAYQSTEVM